MNHDTILHAVETTSLAIVETPLGPFTLEASSRGITRAGWLSPLPACRSAGDAGPGVKVLRQAADELRAYFLGSVHRFGVALDLQGTPFQRAVWEALLEIPCGSSATYGALARRLGKPGAARAVGAACGANPAAVLVPCHRVLGSKGALTGYRYGVETKRWLLELETRNRGGGRAWF